jgi:hypothetical protein
MLAYCCLSDPQSPYNETHKRRIAYMAKGNERCIKSSLTTSLVAIDALHYISSFYEGLYPLCSGYTFLYISLHRWASLRMAVELPVFRIIPKYQLLPFLAFSERLISKNHQSQTCCKAVEFSLPFSSC